jgi:hypothetical protein
MSPRGGPAVANRVSPFPTRLRPNERICRGCGCTDSHACVTAAGPCCWVLLDIETPSGVCSACAQACDYDQRLFFLT